MIIFKELLVKTTLLIADCLIVLCSIHMALFTRKLFESYFNQPLIHDHIIYSNIWLACIISVTIFSLLKMYSIRMDFWQELHVIMKSCILICILIFSLLAVAQEIQNYSRFTILLSCLITMIILPLQKNIIKRWLFQIGFWDKKAFVLGKDLFFSEHVFSNSYLGYTQATKDDAKVLFIAASYNEREIERLLHHALIKQQEVIFVPIVKNYDFTRAHFVQLTNARSNLIIVKNHLLDVSSKIFKNVFDILISLLSFFASFPLLGIVACLIKIEDRYAPIFFKQKRLGLGGKIFTCYKFRTMKTNSEQILACYLEKNSEEKRYYQEFHKYKNDPRITRVGAFLRKTSLDELPQILNVLKGDMSLIGPRPYMVQERLKLKDNADIILVVKPGITGLWQVSGRSNVSFKKRIELDVWYVRNWSIELDIQILMKTVLVVLGRKGSY